MRATAEQHADAMRLGYAIDVVKRDGVIIDIAYRPKGSSVEVVEDRHSHDGR